MNASWGDFDNDGNLDVYVTNYMTCTGEWATEEEIISQVVVLPGHAVPQQRRRHVLRCDVVPRERSRHA